MHTGVFLYPNRRTKDAKSIPRAYGGVSKPNIDAVADNKYSPCIRGCFQHSFHRCLHTMVFPVHTGVFLKLQKIIMAR